MNYLRIINIILASLGTISYLVGIILFYKYLIFMIGLITIHIFLTVLYSLKHNKKILVINTIMFILLLLVILIPFKPSKMGAKGMNFNCECVGIEKTGFRQHEIFWVHTECIGVLKNCTVYNHYLNQSVEPVDAS